MKKQVTLSLAAITVIMFVIISCNETLNETGNKAECCQAVNADSLIARWNDAWNSKNMEALQGMIADSAFVMDHEWQCQGKDSIFAKWINPSLPLIGNLETTALKINSCCCCVSMTGLYTLDYTSDKGVEKAKGNFTFIWNMQEDSTYKLEVMHLTEFHNPERK